MKLNYTKLKNLVAQGESDTLEFKKSTGQLTQAAKTLCAFLNTKGGVVLFGVTDARKIIGQELSSETKEKIAAIVNQFSPPINFDIEYVKIRGTDNYVIAIKAKVNKEGTLYTYNGKAYYRNQNTNTPMSYERYNDKLIQNLKLDRQWNTYLAEGYTIDDLDLNEIKDTVSEGIAEGRLPKTLANTETKKVLQGFGLMTEDSLRNAAVVLFAKTIKPNFLHCKVKLARFVGKTKTKGFIDEKQYEDNAFNIIKESENFIRRNMKIGMEFPPDQMQRIDKPEYLMLAIREALVNSVVHRDYLLHGNAIMIAMYDDRLEIWNPGKLLSEVTLEELKEPHHTSAHRNELIAKIFHSRKFIEGWGTGTRKIIEICEEAGHKEPIYSETNSGFMVTFWSAAYKEEEKEGVISKLAISREEAIIQILREFKRPVSSSEVKQKLDALGTFEKVTVRTINRDLTVLVQQGKVEKTGAGRGIVWKLIEK